MYSLAEMVSEPSSTISAPSLEVLLGEILRRVLELQTIDVHDVDA